MATAKYKHATSVVADLTDQAIADGNSAALEKNIEDAIGIVVSIKCVYGASSNSGLTVRVADALGDGEQYASDLAALIEFEMPYAAGETRYVTVPVLLPGAGPQIKLVLENETNDDVTVSVRSRLIDGVEVD